jgi:hypothetical protein
MRDIFINHLKKNTMTELQNQIDAVIRDISIAQQKIRINNCKKLSDPDHFHLYEYENDITKCAILYLKRKLHRLQDCTDLVESGQMIFHSNY